MPTYRVRRKSDGAVLTVEASSPAEAMALAPTKGVVVPKAKAIDVSPSGYMAEGAKRRAGDIGAMIGGAVMPGRGALGLASRVLGAELGQEAGDVATGQNITPGWGAASQAFGEGLGGAVKGALNPAAYRAFATRSAKALGDQLKELVPSWASFGSDAKGLYEMAHGTGQRLLSRSFDQAIQAIKQAIPDTFIVQVPQMLETAGVRELTTAPRNARMLIDEVPDLRKAGGKPYRDALKALADQLPEGLSDVFDATRGEYKAGSGWIEFAEKGKFLHGEKYDPATAQAALDRFGKKTLLGRWMDDIRATVRGPGKDPISVTTLTPWSKRIAGTEVGAPVLGHGLSGLAGSALLPSEIYKNVPLTPAAQFAARVGPAVIGEGVREGVRDLAPGLKEKLSVELPGQAAEEARRRAGITP